MIRLPVFVAPPVAAAELDTEPEVRFPLIAVADSRRGAQSPGSQLDRIIGRGSKLDSDAGALRAQVLQKSGAGLAAAGNFHQMGAEVARAAPPLTRRLRLGALGGRAAGGHINDAMGERR